MMISLVIGNLLFGTEFVFVLTLSLTRPLGEELVYAVEITERIASGALTASVKKNANDARRLLPGGRILSSAPSGFIRPLSRAT